MRPASVDRDSHSRRLSIHHLRLIQNAKHVDMKDAKVALDIILRPSLRLWKLAIRRDVFPTFKRPKRTALLCDDTSSTSSVALKKKVRFDEKPVTISRRGFFERSRKDPSLSPTRPCLVIRESGGEVRNESSTPSPENDALSVYEDSLSYHPNFALDLDDHLDTRPPKRRRRSEFYEMESGIATFDRTGYASYCLSRWLDKKREAARAPRERMLEDSAPSPFPSDTVPLPAPLSAPPDTARLPPALICRPSCSLSWRMCRYIEDELQNAVVVLVIGLFIHFCLFLLLVYDILTRGFVPSDD